MPPTGTRCARSPDGSSERSDRRCSRSGHDRHPADGVSCHGDPRAPRGGERCEELSPRRLGARRSPWPISRIATGRSRRRRSPGFWGRRPRPPSTSSGASTNAACAASRSARTRPPSSPTPCSPSWIAPSGTRALDISDGSTTSSCGVRAATSAPRFARSTTVAAPMGLTLHPAKTKFLTDLREARTVCARRAGLLYHRGAVRTLYRASRIVTLSHPSDGGVDPRRRAPRAARGDRRPSGGGPHDRASRHDHRPRVHRQSCAPHGYRALADERGRPGFHVQGGAPRPRPATIGGGDVSGPPRRLRRIPLGSPGSADGRGTGRAHRPAGRRDADRRAHLRGELGGARRCRPHGRGRGRGRGGREPHRPAHDGGEPPRLSMGRRRPTNVV